MSVFGYLFRRKKSSAEVDAPDRAATFSYHVKSGMTAIICAFLMIAIVELTVVHYFVAKWNALLAWLLTISSIWVALTIMAQLRTLGWRPHVLYDRHLRLRNGMYDLASIPTGRVERVERSGKEPVTEKGGLQPLRTCVPIGHNIVLHLNDDCQATLLYGQSRPFRVALIYADDPGKMIDAVMSSKSDPANDPSA